MLRPMNVRKQHWMVAALLACAAACTTSPASTAANARRPVPQHLAVGASSPANPVPGKCCAPPPEPTLAIKVTPKSGPVGTFARLLITGCGEASTADAATISFNNDGLNPSARNEPNTVRNLGVHVGTRVQLPYRIQQSDRTGGSGLFYVQCGQTVLTEPFTVTG